MKTPPILLAGLLALSASAPAYAFDSVLPSPRIKDNGDIRLSDDLKIGKYQGGKFYSQPDNIQTQDPGSTGPIDGMSVTAPGAGGIARAIGERLRDLPVYPQDYGAKCDGSANDHLAYQKAADVATATGRALHGAVIISASSPARLP